MKFIRNIDELSAICCNNDSIGLMSGSFNPPHVGHLKVLEKSISDYVDCAIVFPHSHNPNKKNQLVPIVHRIAMLEILLGNSKCSQKLFVAAPPLFDGIGKNELDLINTCRDNYNGKCKYWIIRDYHGIVDTYFEFKRTIPHILHKRDNSSDDAVLSAVGNILSGDKIIMENVAMESSTLIRGAYALGADTRSILCEEIHTYIVKHGLYSQDKNHKKVQTLIKSPVVGACTKDMGQWMR